MKLEATGGRSLTALDESGCLLIPGGKVLRYLAEVPFFVAIIVCWIWLAVVMVLASMERIPNEKAMVLLAASLGVALVLRSVRSVLVKTLLRWRAGGFLREFRGLESRPIALEEGLTIKKVKFLTEDEGVCLMDPQRQRLLIEGCSYRYLVYARDIYSLRPISAYALSGARLVFRTGGGTVDMVLKVSGQGPLGSLLQAFAPHTPASGLATLLNLTLFGNAVPEFHQSALPPPVPQAPDSA